MGILSESKASQKPIVKSPTSIDSEPGVAQGGCWWDYSSKNEKKKEKKEKEKKEKNKKKGGKKGIESKIR